MRPFSIIVAVDEKLGIGKDGQLPWHLPSDLKHFKEITSKTESSSRKNALIMGRKTWESIPEKFRPLPGRVNVVLTRNSHYKVPSGILISPSLKEALEKLDGMSFKEAIEKVFVIGGGEVFRQSLRFQECQKIYVTRIGQTFDCDVFFPRFEEDFQLIHEGQIFIENDIPFRFQEHNRL